MNYPVISVVIGSFNRAPLLKLCIEAVRDELADIAHEIIVVDGGSSDGALEWLVEQKDVITIVQHNRGEWRGKPIERKPWAYFMNLAFKSACGRFTCMLSDDTLLVPGAIRNGLDLFEEKLAAGEKLGAVAFYFRDFPVRKRHSVAVNLGRLYVNHGIYLTEAVKAVDYLDESFHFYFADTDLVLRMNEAGYACIPSTESFVEHYFEATPEIRSSNNDAKKDGDRMKLIERWRGRAYPEDRYEKYRERVGYWQPHPDEHFRDEHRTINRLVAVSHDDMPETMPLVSVVTVVRNDRDGLERTLDSVKMQTYPLIEMIVIDGASTDGTVSVMRRNAAWLDHAVSEKDSGIYNAMNKGLDRATGQYVIFMNAGDCFSRPHSLATLARAAHDDHEADVLYGDHMLVKGSKRFKRAARPIDTLVERMPFNHQSAIFRTELVRKLRFNETYRYAADYDQLVRLTRSGAVFRKVDVVVADFLAGGASQSGIKPYLEVMKIQMEAFDKEDIVRSSVYYRSFVENFQSMMS